MSASSPHGLPFGRYLLVERVASGGMAEVYRGLYRPAPGVEKTVALKRVLPHLAQDDEFLTLFRQEAAVGARLQHANVVQLLDFGEVNGEPFLALEFVDGRNLRQILRRCAESRSVLPTGIALYIAAEAAKGLAYAHALKDADGQPLGIVHRDVSPANVLVSFEGEVKVADFGIARATAYASITSAGLVRGKASYMSPEQARGLFVDGRADEFSLATVLWELLTGRRLFRGDSETEILAKVVSGPIPPPSEAAPGLPPAVDEVLDRALSRDPDSRYPDLIAFSRALSGAASRLGPPVGSPELSAWLQPLFEGERQRPVSPLTQVTHAGAPATATARSPVAPSPVVPPLPPAPSPYADDLEPEVAPLPLEERRKLFDLPPPREAATGPAAPRSVAPPKDEPLELVDETSLRAAEEAVTRIRVRRAAPIGIQVLRLLTVGVVAAIALYAGLAFVFRK